MPAAVTKGKLIRIAGALNPAVDGSTGVPREPRRAKCRVPKAHSAPCVTVVGANKCQLAAEALEPTGERRVDELEAGDLAAATFRSVVANAKRYARVDRPVPILSRRGKKTHGAFAFP
jgi:hypothetical protein